MNRTQLYEQIKKKNSYLCVGLDTDLEKIPKHLLKTDDPVFEFNKQIIDATQEFCIAYKPNIAFYESLGARGWESLQKTLAYIPKDCFTIADAKRGDMNAAAYTLVHYLVFGRQKSLRLPYGQFLRNGAKGKISIGAFCDALEMSKKDIESAWRAYVEEQAR